MKSARHRRVLSEPVEPRLLWAAHVAGSSVSYATIQSAVNAAPAGGTVTVDAGTYAETVTVAKPLTLRGAQAGVDARGNGRPTASAATESLVTGAASGSGRARAFHVLADNVTIDGFTAAGETDQADALGAGIVIGPNRAGTHLLNDVVRDNVAGIFLANASTTNPALIQHCWIGNNNQAGGNGGRGIYTNTTISGGTLINVTIDANTFSNNRGGSGTTGYEAAVAYEAGSAGRQSDVRITNNSFIGNGKATLFFHTTGVLIQGNTATGTQDKWSGTLRFEGDNHDVRILYNTADANRGPAVAVDSKGVPGDNSGFVVNYNNFYNNNTGYARRIGVANNFDSYVGTFDARFNYWGAASGPAGLGAGTGDAVLGGYMDQSTGQGWQQASSGDDALLKFAPFATTTVVAPTAGAVPAAPSKLTAVATSTSQVALAWTDNANGSATGFVVQRSGDGGATFATVATTSTTTYADAGLAAGTTYAYRVLATNAAGSSPASGTVGVTMPSTATNTTVSLTTLRPTSAAVGYGTLHTNASVNGNPLKVRGTTYAAGLGTHATSTITYALAGKYATFAADVGVDDEVNGNGAVRFVVLGDGVRLYDGGVVTGTSPVGRFAVTVAGVQVLTLQALPGVAGSIDYDHADWANPRLTLAATTPATLARRTGTVIGTPGSYGNAGNTAAKANDGSLATYVDGPTASGNWVGLDLGSVRSVAQIQFAPRGGYAARMVGGVFQASTSADFSTGVTTLYTVTTAPAAGTLTTVTLATPVTARYFRYLSPTGSYGNVAEVAFYG